MAIVKLKKISFCGLSQNKKSTLQALQTIGGLHLIPTQEGVTGESNETSGPIENAYSALKYLKQCSKIRHQVEQGDNFDIERIVARVSEIKTERRALRDKRDFLAKRIQEISPWGDFLLPEEGLPGGLKLWFYIVPVRLMKRVRSAELVWKIVHRDNLYCYVVVVSRTEPAAEAMPVPRTHTGQTSLSELHKQLNDIELRREDLQAERESLTRWIGLLERHLAEFEDREQLKRALAATLANDDVFIVQAWVPVERLNIYRKFASMQNLAIWIEDPNERDNPPTLLKNEKPISSGEDVVLFYQTPGYYAWDPSGVVFFSFALFFAMILSDAGYAALLAVFLLLKWRSLGLSERGQRLRRLGLTIVLMSMVWGVLIGSYWGYSPPENTLAGFFKILDINDFDSMMGLSIAIGVLHLVLANLITAWQNRARSIALAALGWAAMTVAGYVLWLGVQSGNGLIRQSGFFMLAAALLAVLFFSSDRVVHKPLDWLWRMLDGFMQLARVTKIFGDVLSYMRLFALGLASASLALTFNQLAGQAAQTQSGLGLLSAILILLLGHGLNLLLCLMSGVVHGLRLNFIEFYNWSLSDEGYPFKAFAKKGDRHE